MKTVTLRNEILGPMDERYRADPASADRITDMKRSPRGGWEQAGGYVPVDEMVTGEVRKLHWFSQHNGARSWLVFEVVNGSVMDLFFWDFSAGSKTLIQGGRKLVPGPNPGTQFLEWGNWLYIFNGYDEPIRWNGREVVRVGFDRAPPAPTISKQNEVDLVAATFGPGAAITFHPTGQRGLGEVDVSNDQNWRFGWAWTWQNDQGHESPPSQIAFFSGTNDSLGAGLSSGPGFANVNVKSEAAPASTRGWKLWRTSNVFGVSTVGQQGFALYFHSSYPGGAGLDIVDDHPNRELGLQLLPNNSGVFPRGVQFAAIYKNTLFADGGPEYPDRIFFSSPGFIEQMPPENFFVIGDRRSGRPLGIRATKNAVIIFKARGIYLIKGDSRNGFFSETLTEDIGGYPIGEIPGIGLVFVGDAGPHVLVGALEHSGVPTRVEELVTPIADTWKQRVNTSALANATGIIYHRDRELWIQVPADGSDRPILGLVFHYDGGGWSLREDYPISDFAESTDRGYLYFSSWDDVNHEGLFVYTGVLDKDGDTLTASYQTAWMHFGVRSNYLHFIPYMLTHERALDIDLRVDRRLAYVDITDDDPYRSTDTEFDAEVWGTAIWDATKSWEDYEPHLIRTDLPFHPNGAQAFELQIRIEANRMHLISFDLHISNKGGATDIKPLHTLGD